MSSFPTRRLTNEIEAVGGKGHYSGDLLDFQLLARPAQAIAQRTDRRHHRPARTACAQAAGPGPPAPTSTTRATTRCSTRRRGRRVELSLNQTLGVVAVCCVELPNPAEIYTGGRCLLELFACTRCETHHRQNHYEPHGAIL